MIKIVATRYQILRLKCTKFNCWGSLQCSPRPPSWIKGAYSQVEGRGPEGEEGRGPEGEEGKGRED